MSVDRRLREIQRFEVPNYYRNLRRVTIKPKKAKHFLYNSKLIKSLEAYGFTSEKAMRRCSCGACSDWRCCSCRCYGSLRGWYVYHPGLSAREGRRLIRRIMAEK